MQHVIKNGTITFQAIPFPLTGMYREKLIELGKIAHGWFKKCEVDNSMHHQLKHKGAMADLEKYEQHLRDQLGVTTTKPFIESIQQTKKGK